MLVTSKGREVTMERQHGGDYLLYCLLEQRTESPVSHRHSLSIIPPYMYPVKVKDTAKLSRFWPKNRMSCWRKGGRRKLCEGRAWHITQLFFFSLQRGGNYNSRIINHVLSAELNIWFAIKIRPIRQHAVHKCPRQCFSYFIEAKSGNVRKKDRLLV